MIVTSVFQVVMVLHGKSVTKKLGETAKHTPMKINNLS